MEDKVIRTGLEDLSPAESADAKKWFEKHKDLLAARESHFSILELHELAEARKSWGEFWEMPKHLASCPVCLDCFETLLKGDTKVDEAVLVEMRKIHPLRMFSLTLRKFEPFKLAKLAAAVAIFAVAGWYAISYFSVPSVKILDGTLLMSDGRQMSSGSTVPDESELTAAQPTNAVFNDGSKILISKDSMISLLPSHFSNKTIQLSDGNIVCEITRQKSGRSFKVLTPAGEITVVGTKFSVDSRSSRNSDSSSKELKFIHPTQLGVKDDANPANNIDCVVTVKVEEGVVMVKNRHGSQNELMAGQTAVLRRGISVIDVFDGK
ncbi:MAG TPA: hypothetical protein DCZ94_14300 [Lentisphaeria bacterium]|nr:MAG: hypothetical protein A2X48_01735 [Lentisphaerae bacterium GWF2_49_21]HBC88118.1 hypothetical protein [Lentisphaeria bacterium]